MAHSLNRPIHKICHCSVNNDQNDMNRVSVWRRDSTLAEDISLWFTCALLLLQWKIISVLYPTCKNVKFKFNSTYSIVVMAIRSSRPDTWHWHVQSMSMEKYRSLADWSQKTWCCAGTVQIYLICTTWVSKLLLRVTLNCYTFLEKTWRGGISSPRRPHSNLGYFIHCIHILEYWHTCVCVLGKAKSDWNYQLANTSKSIFMCVVTVQISRNNWAIMSLLTKSLVTFLNHFKFEIGSDTELGFSKRKCSGNDAKLLCSVNIEEIYG